MAELLGVSSAKGLDSEKGSMKVEASRVVLPSADAEFPCNRSETEWVGDVIGGFAAAACVVGVWCVSWSGVPLACLLYFLSVLLVVLLFWSWGVLASLPCTKDGME